MSYEATCKNSRSYGFFLIFKNRRLLCSHFGESIGADVLVYHSVDFEDPIDYEDLMKVGNEPSASEDGNVPALLRRFKMPFDHYGEARASRSYYAPVASVKVAKEALAQFLKQNFSELLSGLNS